MFDVFAASSCVDCGDDDEAEDEDEDEDAPLCLLCSVNRSRSGVCSALFELIVLNI